LFNKNFKGCYTPIETLLSLTDLIKKCAVVRGEKKIEMEISSLFQQIPVMPVTCNWNEWVPSLTGNYIDVINSTSAIPAAALLGEYADFGDVGLNTMLTRSSNLKNSFNNTVKAIRFSFDSKNRTQTHIGQSQYLFPKLYVTSISNGELVIKMNLSLNPKKIPAVGRVIHFQLQQGEATAEESREVSKRANSMRKQEQERRDDELKRAQNENKEIERQNKQDQEDYAKKMKEWEKETNEKCNYSQCNKGYQKCGVCNSRGWNENNGHKSTCSSCKGQGKNECGHCNGTMKKHPNGLSQPSIPSSRSIRDMPTFGSMPNYEDMI